MRSPRRFSTRPQTAELRPRRDDAFLVHPGLRNRPARQLMQRDCEDCRRWRSKPLIPQTVFQHTAQYIGLNPSIRQTTPEQGIKPIGRINRILRDNNLDNILIHRVYSPKIRPELLGRQSGSSIDRWSVLNSFHDPSGRLNRSTKVSGDQSFFFFFFHRAAEDVGGADYYLPAAHPCLAEVAVANRELRAGSALPVLMERIELASYRSGHHQRARRPSSTRLRRSGEPRGSTCSTPALREIVDKRDRKCRTEPRWIDRLSRCMPTDRSASPTNGRGLGRLDPVTREERHQDAGHRAGRQQVLGAHRRCQHRCRSLNGISAAAAFSSLGPMSRCGAQS